MTPDADIFTSIAAAVGVLFAVGMLLQYVLPRFVPWLRASTPASRVIRLGLFFLAAWLVGSLWLHLNFGLVLVVYFVLVLVLVLLPGGRR